MALTVFRWFGSLMTGAAGGWADAGQTIGCKLYQSGGAAPQTGWQTIAELESNGWTPAASANNPVTIPSGQRTFGGWNTGSHLLNYTLTDQVNFGAGGSGDTLGGIAVYWELAANDNNRYLLWWDDSNVNGVTVGTGDCIWGSAGASTAVNVQSIVPPTTDVFFMQSAKTEWHNLVDTWTGTDTFKWRLYNTGTGGATSPSSDLTLAQITMPICQAAAGGDVTDVLVPQGHRSLSWANNRWEFRITPAGFQSYSFGTVASGQQPEAVALARGDLGTADADAELWYWDGGMSVAPLASDREITYGPASTFVAFYSEPL